MSAKRPLYDINPLIETVYRATLDASKWTDAVSQLAETFGGAGTIFSQDMRNAEGILFEAAGFSPEGLQAYFDHFAAVNPWTPIMATLEPGSVTDSDEMIPRHIFEQTEFYNDWLKPQGLYLGLGSLLARDDNVLSLISVLRPFAPDGNSPEGRAAWARVMPHFRRAMRVRQEIGTAGLARDAAFAALDQLAVGALVVDAVGQILFANRVALNWLRARDGIAEIGRRLHTETPAATESLLALITQAPKTPALVSDGWLPLPRRFGASGPRRPLGALVCPLQPENPAQLRTLGMPRPAALVLIRDPNSADAAGIQPTVLMGLFGLTRAEARLTAALAAGKSVEEVALESSVSLNTARTHLKSVLTKTGTSRQGELVALVLRSVILTA